MHTLRHIRQQRREAATEGPIGHRCGGCRYIFRLTLDDQIPDAVHRHGWWWHPQCLPRQETDHAPTEPDQDR